MGPDRFRPLGFKGKSSMRKIPLTLVGAEMLRAELHQLKTVERPRVILAIQDARAHGDLSENAEYDAAKERQSFIEGRIAELEIKLGKISFASPIGRALIGKESGDVAEVQAPGGVRSYEIRDVKYI